jgi:hypothetical protein
MVYGLKHLNEHEYRKYLPCVDSYSPTDAFSSPCLMRLLSGKIREDPFEVFLTYVRDFGGIGHDDVN